MRRLAMTGEMFVVAVSAFDESAGRVTFACVPKRSYGPDLPSCGDAIEDGEAVNFRGIAVGPADETGTSATDAGIPLSGPLDEDVNGATDQACRPCGRDALLVGHGRALATALDLVGHLASQRRGRSAVLGEVGEDADVIKPRFIHECQD